MMHKTPKKHEPPKPPAESHHSSLKVPHRFNELLAHPQIIEPMKTLLRAVHAEIGKVRSLPENEKKPYVKQLVEGETALHAQSRELNVLITSILGEEHRIHKKEIAATILTGAKGNV